MISDDKRQPDTSRTPHDIATEWKYWIPNSGSSSVEWDRFILARGLLEAERELTEVRANAARAMRATNLPEFRDALRNPPSAIPAVERVYDIPSVVGEKKFVQYKDLPSSEPAKLPGRRSTTAGSMHALGYNEGWNACLNAVEASLESATKDSHVELLAIHAAVMDPQSVKFNEADTYTLKRVKEFILAYLYTEAHR